MIERYSVAIVGAGPTGLMLANLLGKEGVLTLLIEANAATVGEPRAVSIDDESLRVVEQIGLLDPVMAEIVSGYGSEYLGPDRSRFLKIKPEAKPYGHHRRNAFRQPIFEAQLRQGLGQRPEIDPRFECRLESFEDTADGVLIHLLDKNGSQRILVDYLIGCDGSSSSTRAQLGYSLAGASPAERWLIIDLENCPSPSPETTVYCDPRRPGIMLPGPRDTRRYEFKLMPGETDAVMLTENMVEKLLTAHDGVAKARVVRKTVYHFHARVVDQWGRGRVWLAGDAAHLMPPFAGQGMNGGIRDAANLAWKLAAIVQGRLGPNLLITYQRERSTHIQQMIRLALRMGAIFAPRNALHGWAIRTAFRILGTWPTARTYFAEMKYKPSPRFERGFFLEDQTSRRGLVGRMLPQPNIATPHGLRGLDDLLGCGFSLIGVDVDDAFINGLSLGESWDRLIQNRVKLDTAEVSEFARQSGKLLLVRPDRYVMAEFTAGESRKIAGQLNQLLTETWDNNPIAPSQGVFIPCANTETGPPLLSEPNANLTI